MSPTLASIAVLGLYLLAVAPLAFALAKPAIVAPLMLFYGVLTSGLVLYHAGIVDPSGRIRLSKQQLETIGQAPAGSIAPTFAGAGSPRPPAEACAQALTMAEQAQLVRRQGRSYAAINDQLWSRLPEQVQQALRLCLGSGAPSKRPQPAPSQD